MGSAARRLTKAAGSQKRQQPKTEAEIAKAKAEEVDAIRAKQVAARFQRRDRLDRRKGSGGHATVDQVVAAYQGVISRDAIQLLKPQYLDELLRYAVQTARRGFALKAPRVLQEILEYDAQRRLAALANQEAKERAEAATGDGEAAPEVEAGT